jgi:hypothetical protein
MFEIYKELMELAVYLMDGNFASKCGGLFIAFVATVYLIKLVSLPFHVAEIYKMMKK